MKKIVSIILATLMILSVANAFAADVTYPENLASYTGKADVKQSSPIKCDVTGVTVTTGNGETNNSFGAPASIFDGIGMVPQTLSDLNTQYAGTEYNNKWRWFANVTTPTITMTFPEALTFDKIAFSEARKRMTGYTLTFKNNNVVVKTVEGTFDDGTNETNKLFLRSIDIGDAVTADEIVFEVVAAKTVSISEMEFTNGSITLENAASILNSSGSTVIESMMDGVIGQEDGKPLAAGDRIVINKNNCPKITVEFGKDITFDTIKHAEVRQMIQKYRVTVYKDGETVFVSDELTFTDGKNTSNLNTTWIRSMNIGRSVTGDTVTIEVTELTNATNVLSIAEIEFWTTLSDVTIKDADGVAIPGTAGTDVVANIVNGAYDNKLITNDNTNRFRFTVYNTETKEVQYKLPYTIELDLGGNKTFNYAELSEIRCLFGAIDVYTSTNGTTWNLAGTMPRMAYNGDLNKEFLHSVSFNPVTARYVRYVIKEIADYNDIKKEGSAHTAHINEVAVCNYAVEDDVKIYPIRIFDENATSLVYTYDKTTADETTTITELHRTVNASILINNDENEAKNYKILAGEYTEDGMLLSMRVKDVTVPANTSRVENLTLLLDQSISKIDAQACKVYFMVWDGKTLVPYCQAEIGPYQN